MLLSFFEYMLNKTPPPPGYFFLSNCFKIVLDEKIILRPNWRKVPFFPKYLKFWSEQGIVEKFYPFTRILQQITYFFLIFGSSKTHLFVEKSFFWRDTTILEHICCNVVLKNLKARKRAICENCWISKLMKKTHAARERFSFHIIIMAEHIKRA